MHGIGHNGGPVADIDDRGGWIKEHRDSRTHPLIGYGQPVPPADPERGSYSRNEAWRDFLCECAYKDGRINNGGRMMTIHRGEMVGAISYLAKRWNWTPKTVRTWLDKLETEGMIERFMVGSDQVRERPKRGNHGGKQASVLKACNYWKYQDDAAATGQSEGQAKGKQGASKGQAEGNNLRRKEGNNIYTLSETPVGVADSGELQFVADSGELQFDAEHPPKPRKQRRGYTIEFEAWWKSYPDTTNNSKANAFVEWSHLSPEDREFATVAIKPFTDYCRANPDYRCIHAERFLKHRRFEGFAERSKTPAKAANEVEPYWWKGKDIAMLRALPDETWDRLIGRYANGVWPVAYLGPGPHDQQGRLQSADFLRDRAADLGQYRGDLVQEFEGEH